jgi:hypothetical protein
MAEDACCELIDPKEWDGKTLSWKGKPFVRKKYFAILYMPIGLDGVLRKLMGELNEKKLIPEEHPIMLFRNEGPFGGEILLAIKKKDPAYEVVTLSGSFFTKSYEGKSYSDAGNWHKDFQEAARGKGVKETMAEYVLCPGCQKKFGKMQAILFGKLS